MGRESKAKQAKRIKLEKVEYFELMSALRLHEVIRLEAQQKAARIAADMVAKDIEASGKKGQALLEALGKKYGFQATANYGFDDATHELIPR
jgi:hypothetical protein